MKINFFRCGNLRILLILCLFASIMNVQANVIRGRVVDAETGEPLEGAQVNVKENFDFGSFVCNLETDSLGCFHYHCGTARLTFTAKFFGYYEGTFLTSGIEGNDTVRIKDIRLKPSPLLLKEVKVTGNKRRFYMRGDTVVFNPEAFHLEEGARLAELIAKLPGVSVKDGILLWMGEPLKLMMNGQEVFSKEMLMKHLPVEALENIKAYDRKSELEERTGVADGKKEHVLDVNIKPSFMDKMYGELTAAAYSSQNYALALDAMRLSDTDPLLLFGRVADEPGEMLYRTINTFGSNNDGTPVLQQMGSVGYQHLWKKTNEGGRPNRWNITGSLNHTDRSSRSWENTQTFLPNTAPTESNSTRYNRQHAIEAPLDFHYYLNIGKKDVLSISSKLTYKEGRNESRQEQSTFEADSLMETSLMSKINASTYKSLHRSKSFSGHGDAQFTHYFKGGSFSTGVSFNYSDMSGHGSSEGEYHYYHSDAISNIDKQSSDTDSRQVGAGWKMGVSRAFGKNFMTNASFSTNYQHSNRDEERLRADTLDFANSLSQHDSNWKNELSMSANLQLGTFALKPSINLSYQHERLNYQRAKLDTLARRNLFIVLPSLSVDYKIQKQMSIKGSFSYSTSPANLLDCIDYTDDTNPLYIRQGNPYLKNTHTLHANLTYYLMLTRASQALNFSVNYRKNDDPIATLLHYNSQTGVYHSQKQNVRGGDTWEYTINYDRSLGSNIYLHNKLTETLGRHYGLLTLVDEATEVTYNRQNRSALAHFLECDCNFTFWKVNLYNNFQWERHTYSDAALSSQNIFFDEMVLTLRYSLAHWIFMLRPALFVEQGHIASGMNTNQFRLNASITYKFQHNHAELTLLGCDLFNQVKRNTYSITPTSRTEGGQEYLHRYVSLTFKYKFDAKAKK